MKIILLVPLFLACVTASAQARLGESMSALVERYGQPIPDAGQKDGSTAPAGPLKFEKNGFRIEVTLQDEISAAESFKKLNGDPLTSEEVQTLLAANSQGRAWQPPQTINPRLKQWTRDDGAMAVLGDGHVLKLTSRELLNSEARAKQLKAAPSLEGF